MAERENLEAHDGMAGLRNALRSVGEGLGYWCGIPMPLEGEALVVEPNYPKAAELMAMCGGAPRPRDPYDAQCSLRSTFYSTPKRSDIFIWREADGRVEWGLKPAAHHLKLDMATLGCSDAWGIEQESNALHTLGTLIRHRQFKQYLLTGSFLETSPRSHVTYMFRRLKPTVAITSRDKSGDLRILCTLCLHAIGYYSGSWAGAMCPSDDVIAHLMLMRGDEKMFWRRANQHAAYRPESGL